MPIGRGGGIDGADDDGSGLVTPDQGMVAVPFETDGAAAVELPASDTAEGWVFSG